MKEYPSILSASDLLARSEDYLGRPFVAFDMLDGSNIRAEWDRKRGRHLFGSRRRPRRRHHLIGLLGAGREEGGVGGGVNREELPPPGP